MDAVRTQRGTVMVGKCYSGLLAPSQRKVLRHTALATHDSFNHLITNVSLRSLLRDQLESSGNINPQTLEDAGFRWTIFHGRKNWQTFGIYYEHESASFRSALNRLANLSTGTHRRVLFALLGLTTPQRIETLSRQQYGSLFAVIYRQYNDPIFETIREIRLTERPVGMDAGSPKDRVLTLSIQQLEREEFISHIEMAAFIQGVEIFT